MDVWQLLKSVGAPEGGEIVAARDRTEPDGSQYVSILVDYGKDGTKKFVVPMPPDDPADPEAEAPPVKKGKKN